MAVTEMAGMAANMLIILVTLITACSGLQARSQLNQPPIITDMPDRIIYYKYKETVMMPCKGYGTEPLKFTWTKDEVPFQPRAHDKRMVQLAREGTIVINFPEDKDEGYYKCYAQNPFGTALASVVKLQPGRLAEFEPKPKFIHRKRMGERLKLPCTPPTSMPKGHIAWAIYKSSRFTIVEYDEHVTLDRDGNLLFLSLRKGDDMGGDAYRCMVFNDFMRDNKVGEEHVIILEGDKAIEQPMIQMFNTELEQIGLLGETISMKCVFGGNPIPKITWRKSRGEFPSDRKIVSDYGMNLTLTNLKESDAGSYECEASSSASGRQLRSFIIVINSRPVWQQKPKDVETTVKRKAEFFCSGRGLPRPRIVVRQNSILSSEQPQGAILESGSDGNLSWVSIKYENLEKRDTKVLQCNVTNEHGFVFTNFVLNVLEDAPRFVQPPLELTKVAENYPVRLFCQTSGKPDPVISWYKGNRPMTGGRYRIQRNGDLLIQRAALSDAGQYKCRAVNKFGFEEGSGKLIVRSRTRLVQEPMDVQVNEGKPAKFTCSGTTDPLEMSQLKIIWKRDDMEVMADSQRMTTNIQDNSLTITDTIPRDSGTYTCIATNGIDNTTAHAMLTVKGRPAKPSQMNIKEGTCLQRTVDLVWTSGSDNNSPVTSFVVEYNTSYTPDLWVKAQRSTGSNTVKLSIRPYVIYTFRVRAENKIGVSEPSDPTSECETTPAVAPDKNPENVRSIGDQKGYLIVEWTPMPQIQHNGPSFTYNVMYKKPDALSYNSDVVTVYTQHRWEQKVPDVDPYQPYHIQVIAENSKGKSSSPPKTVIGYTGEAEPELYPQNLATSTRVSHPVTATSAFLEWDPVDTETPTTMNGEFRGYKIQYWKEKSKRTTFREQVLMKSDFRKDCALNKMCAQLTQLIPFTYMQAQVVVINNFYMGPPSNVISFTTKEGLPGPVKSLYALVAGPNHFSLKWEHPDEDDRNGIIIAYDLAYQTVDALVLGKLKDRDHPVEPQFEKATLSGLLPSQRYRLHIWAVTSKGRGEDHYIELNTTATGSPDAPTFEFEFIGEHTMNITWHEYATSGKHSGSIFFVEYRKSGLSEWQKSPDEMVKYWANISSLESGTRYEVRVVTTNGLDYVASAIHRATTSGVGAVHVPSAGWFIGMLVIIFLLIALIILLIILVRCFHFKFDCFAEEPDERRAEPMAMTSSGYRSTYQEKEDRAPPRGAYYNDYDDDYDRRDSMEKYPPAYSDIDRDSYGKYRDDDNPDKFDSGGTPKVEIRDPTRRQQSYEDDTGDRQRGRRNEQPRYQDDRYNDDQYNDYRYDNRDSYDDRRDDRGDDRRDDRGYDRGYDRSRDYDPRYDDDDEYDREPRGGAYTPTKSEGTSSFV